VVSNLVGQRSIAVPLALATGRVDDADLGQAGAEHRSPNDPDERRPAALGSRSLRRRRTHEVDSASVSSVARRRPPAPGRCAGGCPRESRRPLHLALVPERPHLHDGRGDLDHEAPQVEQGAVGSSGRSAPTAPGRSATSSATVRPSAVR